MIAAAFYPKDDVVRLGDFKSSSTPTCLVADATRPTEENPMLGFRGGTLLRPALSRRLRAGVPGHAAGPRGDGPDQCQAHGPLLSYRGGGGKVLAEMQNTGYSKARTVWKSM